MNWFLIMNILGGYLLGIISIQFYYLWASTEKMKKVKSEIIRFPHLIKQLEELPFELYPEIHEAIFHMEKATEILKKVKENDN